MKGNQKEKLTNPQFFILSAFVWMTLMSYEIFKQIRGMQVRYVHFHPFILCHILNRFNMECSRKNPNIINR